MTSARIFRSACISLVGARVLPMDPREQAALDEIRRRRAAKKSQRTAQCPHAESHPASGVGAAAGKQSAR